MTATGFSEGLAMKKQATKRATKNLPTRNGSSVPGGAFTFTRPVDKASPTLYGFYGF